MAGEMRAHLRVVGGNEALARTTRASREARWPPLRLVEAAELADTFEPTAAPMIADASREQVRPQRPVFAPRRRGAWSQALLAGLMVVMLSSVGQAIAAHW